MVLDWLGRSKQASVDELVARKSYAKAIEALKAALQKRRKDRRLRMQLAEVLALAGRPKEAVQILDALADDLALEGRSAQAIAVLKKIQALTPGRSDVEEKLVYLIRQQSRPSQDPWSAGRRNLGLILPESEALGGAAEIGMESLARAPEIGMEQGAEAPPAPASDPLPLEGPAPAAADGDLEGTLPLTDDAMRDEIVALIEDVLRPVPEGEPQAPLAGVLGPEASVTETPLFKDFSPEELTALIQGLRLVSFEPGEIVITEGEPHGSMFVITTGMVRAYVRHTSGRSLPIRDLKEGDFFGEVSVLTGSPRTATITAGSHCELLELDRPTLDAICRSHPRVRQVLADFFRQRSGGTLEEAIRGMTLG